MSLSSSARVAGFTATWSAGAGSVGGGTTTGRPLGARVSPVRVPLRRGTATKSPATTVVAGAVVRPAMLCSAWSRSSSRVRGLTRTASGCSVPETTLHRDILPVWPSLKVLVTVSSVWPPGSHGTSAVSVPAVARTGGREAGVGQSSSMRRASRSTPTPLAAEQHSTGKTLAEATPPARLFSSSP